MTDSAPAPDADADEQNGGALSRERRKQPREARRANATISASVDDSARRSEKRRATCDMPSRQQRRGEAGKESSDGAAASPTGDDDDVLCIALLFPPRAGHQANKCEHTSMPPSSPEDLSRVTHFMRALFGALYKEHNLKTCTMEPGIVRARRAITAANQRSFGALDDDTFWELVKEHLAQKATSLLLGDYSEAYLHRDTSKLTFMTAFSTLAKIVGTFLATPILLIESYDKSNQSFPIVSDLKAQDMVDGCPHSLVKFSAKRSCCNCLDDEKLEQLKSLPKTSVCAKCYKRVKRSGMMQCTGCSLIQYCGRNCQRETWVVHKDFCEHGRDFSENRICYRLMLLLLSTWLLWQECSVMVGDVVVVGVLFWYGVNCTVLYVASSLLVRYIRVLHILWKSSNGDNYDGISLFCALWYHIQFRDSTSRHSNSGPLIGCIWSVKFASLATMMP